MKTLHKIFGGVEMSWRNVIALAIIMGAWTALMALKVPDGNSFHDIAVTPEWWVLPAIFIISNCKKPLEAALKTFVFFLISQPLVYLIQVPFNSMGWNLFIYYKYWFTITLLTFPGAFIGWFIKHDKWYSGVILSVMTVLLVITGINYISAFIATPPNHLISIIYCFTIIPIFILALFKDKIPRIVTTAITILAICIYLPFTNYKVYDVYNNSFIEENGITFVGEPYISSWSGSTTGSVEIIKPQGASYNEYNYKLTCANGHVYYFSITDTETEQEYNFKYYYSEELKTIVIERQ
jgi:hypothetical protein